jgi:uncharacterized damage-inducible protein DinB
MNKEVQSIIRNLRNVLQGEPWYGRAVYEILDETDPATVHKKQNKDGHSSIELLFHMITWAEFTLSRLDSNNNKDLAFFESIDWRKIDPAIHTWPQGMEQLKKTHEQIIVILETKDDEFLKVSVEDRKYNFRFLLNGLIQHNIYHLGQIAYINKFLVN